MHSKLVHYTGTGHGFWGWGLSTFSGPTFSNSPVAAVHVLAYPLDDIFHVSHGLSNALMTKDLSFRASEAMKQTRLLVNNPREVDEAAALTMYQAVF